MIKFDFTNKKPYYKDTFLALTLNRNIMSERIIIGMEHEVKACLENRKSHVYYDKTHSLGHFLFNLEPDKEWGDVLHDLCARKMINRWKGIEAVTDFLQEKYKSNNPANIFAAIRVWEEYTNNTAINFVCLRQPCLPLFIKDGGSPWEINDSITAVLSSISHDDVSPIELWHYAGKPPFEVIVTDDMLLPVISYYLYRLEEWGFVVQRCKVCGEKFMAKSRRYEICSDGCRKAQSANAKRQFDERAKGDKAEQLYESAYYYWYNRLRKKDGAAADTAFKTFRHEATIRKAAVKRKELSVSDFDVWLDEQKKLIDSFL